MTDKKSKIIRKNQEQLRIMTDKNTSQSSFFSPLSSRSPENIGKSPFDGLYFSPLPSPTGAPIASEPTRTWLKGKDETALRMAEAVKEAMHDVIDVELGIDVVDLGLVYGVEIDEKARAIIAMTLTTPTCPLTQMLEDETAEALAGIVDEFRIDWTFDPVWGLQNLTPEGYDQLIALGFPL